MISPLIDSCSRFRFIFLLAVLVAAVASPEHLGAETPTSGAEAEGAHVNFVESVKPILSDRCFRCHGPDATTREADLRLDRQMDVVRETDSGLFAESIVSPGKPDHSELFLRLIAEDPDVRMPPPDSGSKLSKAESKRSANGFCRVRNGRSTGRSGRLPGVQVPDTQSAWPRNSIDHFVLKRMQSRQLQPNKPADRESLVRRAYFDLTGLPPTPDQIDTILSHHDFDVAYEQMVDQLLASHHYGQRMASDWLDVARYSDTYGYQVDRDRYVWPWRDWVVNAFNDNMPYNVFIRDQLAGDLLENATDQQRLATTFNRLHPQKVRAGAPRRNFELNTLPIVRKRSPRPFWG